MRAEDLQDVIKAAPFKPFTLCLADGKRFTIEHSEWIAFRGGRTAIVLDQDERAHFIDVMLALRIDVDPPIPAGSIAPNANGGE